MTDTDDGSQPPPNRRDTPGRFLLAGTLASALFGAVAAALAGGGEVADSNILFRASVGGGVFLVLDVVTAAIHWARQGKTFASISLPGGGGVDAPDQDQKDEQNVEQGLQEGEAQTKRAEHAEAMVDTFQGQLKTNSEQLEHLAKENERLAQENARLRGGLDVVEGQEEYRVSRGTSAGSCPSTD